jgi:hypothetical protein
MKLEKKKTKRKKIEIITKSLFLTFLTLIKTYSSFLIGLNLKINLSNRENYGIFNYIFGEKKIQKDDEF